MVVLQQPSLPDSPDKYMAYTLAALVVLMIVGMGWLKIQKHYAGRGSQAAAPKLLYAEGVRQHVAPVQPVVQEKRDTPIPPVQQPTNAVQRTIEAVAKLAHKTTWPVGSVTVDNIPLMQGVDGWYNLSLLDSEHTVVCGASNSGKGNTLRVVAMSTLILGPDVARLWVFDTKSGVDYPVCTQLEQARLYANIEYADDTVDNGLKRAKQEMDRRNKLMFGVATNIHNYNKKVTPEHRLPIIVMILDEYADLTKQQKELTETIVRQGRSAGFVIFVATQYPTAEVLGSQIQANCMRRICLKLESAKRTEVSLGLAPGEARMYEPSVIEASGVAVYKRAGGKMVIGKTPYISDDEYDQLSDQLRDRYPRVTEDDALDIQPNAKGFYLNIDTDSEDDAGDEREDRARQLAYDRSLSANDILKQVGGNANKIKRIVKETRDAMQAVS